VREDDGGARWIFLWIYGDSLSGIAAMFAQALSNPDSPYPIRVLTPVLTSRCSRLERRAKCVGCDKV
jgi:hypothetical protein